MFTIDPLFSSPAKLKVLRVMVHQESPLPLRRVAALSEAPLFSVQRALGQLVDDQIVLKERRGSFALFSLNKKCVFWLFIRKLFDWESGMKIAESANAAHQRAGNVLNFSDSAGRLLEKARSWTSRNFSQKL